ncbi:hypothetical protein A3F03_00470 [Candidatus Roizmanbacteria bacterium RIFCSPHIGHO2_12_FULL_41_11]|uniref:PIN domain-containing protein n=2 Tax=Candidatus Roizmaniibacteriota TaxID=1752723 RepID=A0A1F7J7W4_9BACT|nr:MAG: hypothetical protein A3F03_00470 [Candidatus Roizmanbacteria bacterium RIFCSPHIGHO2_12_FULL_41_11]OGK51685.1 MAG: hypothetical protein A2966_05105 [Candidatus Roizmanbacteria bacterium RIFCSPLOWO2_01_FULL_41_22]
MNKISNKIFIDTSVIIRFLTRDDEKKYHSCVQLFTQIEVGRLRPYISNIVIIEVIFVLNRLYQFPKKAVLEAIDKLLKLRNMTVIEKTDSKRSLELFSQINIKFQDCLIATQLPINCTLVTYDQEFKKIKQISSLTPSELIEKQ